MKKLILLALLLYGIYGFSQTDTIRLQDLEMPNSPGLILLDQAPTSIERPNTARAFAISIINSVSEENGWPKNYAVEFTPFWFFKHPGMNALKYAGYNGGKPKMFSAARMVSLSLAYVTKTDSVSNLPVTNFALGARTTLLRIYSKDHQKKVYDANLMTLFKLRDLDALLNREGATPQLLFENPAKYKEIENRILEFVSQEDSISPLKDVLKEKPVFAIDGAIAYNRFFTDNDFSTNQFGRFGTWLTLNYSKYLNKDKTNYLNIYAIGRYLSDGTIQNSPGIYENQDFMDFGGKLELEFMNLSLAYEYVYRVNDLKNTYRSISMIKYKISDNFYLNGAFGKNFGDFDNLVALLGINWGLGSTGNEVAKIE